MKRTISEPTTNFQLLLGAGVKFTNNTVKLDYSPKETFTTTPLPCFRYEFFHYVLYVAILLFFTSFQTILFRWKRLKRHYS